MVRPTLVRTVFYIPAQGELVAALLVSGNIPTLRTGATAEVERAKRSGGLHKRSAEDWGRGLRARGGWSPSRF